GGRAMRHETRPVTLRTRWLTIDEGGHVGATGRAPPGFWPGAPRSQLAPISAPTSAPLSLPRPAIVPAHLFGLPEAEIGPTAIRAYGRRVPSWLHDFPLLRCGLAPPRVASRTGLLLGKRAEKLPFRPVALAEQTGHVRSPTGYARGAAERS